MKEYEELREAYDPKDRCGECPDDDASIIRSIEIEFAIPVWMTQDQQRMVHDFVDSITNASCNQIKDGVHWMFFCGGRASFSAVDAALLGKVADPNIKNGDEPTHDDSVFVIETSARQFMSFDERDKKLETRNDGHG